MVARLEGQETRRSSKTLRELYSTRNLSAGIVSLIDHSRARDGRYRLLKARSKRGTVDAAEMATATAETIRPTGNRAFYIASLDGIRGVAFLDVFLAHLGLGTVIPGGFGVLYFSSSVASLSPRSYGLNIKKAANRSESVLSTPDASNPAPVLHRPGYCRPLAVGRIPGRKLQCDFRPFASLSLVQLLLDSARRQLSHRRDDSALVACRGRTLLSVFPPPVSMDSQTLEQESTGRVAAGSMLIMSNLAVCSHLWFACDDGSD